MIMREAAPIYEALGMQPTLKFQMPDDGIKVRPRISSPLPLLATLWHQAPVETVTRRC